MVFGERFRPDRSKTVIFAVRTPLVVELIDSKVRSRCVVLRVTRYACLHAYSRLVLVGPAGHRGGGAAHALTGSVW